MRLLRTQDSRAALVVVLVIIALILMGDWQVIFFIATLWGVAAIATVVNRWIERGEP